MENADRGPGPGLSFIDLLAILVRRWKIIVAVTFVGAAGLAAAAFLAPPAFATGPAQREEISFMVMPKGVYSTLAGTTDAAARGAYETCLRSPVAASAALAEAGIASIKGRAVSSFPDAPSYQAALAKLITDNPDPLIDAGSDYIAVKAEKGGFRVAASFDAPFDRLEAFAGALIEEAGKVLGRIMAGNAEIFRAGDEEARTAQGQLAKAYLASPAAPFSILDGAAYQKNGYLAKRGAFSMKSLLALAGFGVFVLALLCAFIAEYASRLRKDPGQRGKLRAAWEASKKSRKSA